MGNYDFDKIAYFARKRFVEGFNTVDLMNQASCQREKEEIALVAMLDLDDSTVSDLELSCNHADSCQVTNCRALLKDLIEEDLQKATTP